MTIFLLLLTMLLLLNRVHRTPEMLNELTYMNKLQKSLDKLDDSVDNLRKFMSADDINTMMKNVYIFTSVTISLVLSIYYGYIGSMFIENIFLWILSAMQIATVAMTLYKTLDIKMISFDIHDYKFFKWYFLFNVILDYIYYPFVIYMLLIN